jgi:hypothetical protein
VAKIIIDDSELIDARSMATLEKLASFFSRIDDPFRMPDAMTEWLHAQNQSAVDQYYAIPVGYGSMAMQLRFIFKKNMIMMEFLDPNGMRLMEIRLHE